MKKVVVFSCICCLLFVVLGCSKEPVRSSVSGTVTFQGKPFPAGAGTVCFFCKEQDSSARCTIKEEGKYVFPTALPVGNYQVWIGDPPSPGPGGEMGGFVPKPPAKVNFPKKYRSYETSGLTFDVKKGPNEFNITLE